MKTIEFVTGFRQERDNMVKTYLAGEGYVGEKIKQLELNEKQIDIMHDLLEQSITDTMYTLCMALSGEASLGGLEQQEYKIFAEDQSKLEEIADEAVIRNKEIISK